MLWSLLSRDKMNLLKFDICIAKNTAIYGSEYFYFLSVAAICNRSMTELSMSFARAIASTLRGLLMDTESKMEIGARPSRVTRCKQMCVFDSFLLHHHFNVARFAVVRFYLNAIYFAAEMCLSVKYFKLTVPSVKLTHLKNSNGSFTITMFQVEDYTCALYMWNTKKKSLQLWTLFFPARNFCYWLYNLIDITCIILIR